MTTVSRKCMYHKYACASMLKLRDAFVGMPNLVVLRLAYNRRLAPTWLQLLAAPLSWVDFAEPEAIYAA